LLGVFAKTGAERGFLMVNLWWIAGKLTVIFQVRKFSTFPGFIFEGLPFWE
jgi:hypothetical protein